MIIIAGEAGEESGEIYNGVRGWWRDEEEKCLMGSI